ncbi:MAG: YkgJ family cysteine cluster protein [Fibrobacter sp.]|nr:YkgJ family cysteine cluster protein [Fibrobacter sp.]
MNSEITPVLERIKGTEEYDILVETESAYRRIETAQQEWYSKSNFRCPEGCGCCCEHFEPDLLENEALYMAAWLISNKPEWAEQVADGKFPFMAKGRCPFFDPDSKYHCTIYNGRASICRLFGASGSRDKFGNGVWKPCKFYPADVLAKHNPPLAHRQYSAEEIKKVFGAFPPVMSDLMEQEETFTPDDDVTRLVRDVLPERVRHLMWIMELEEGRDPR